MQFKVAFCVLLFFSYFIFSPILGCRKNETEGLACHLEQAHSTGTLQVTLCYAASGDICNNKTSFKSFASKFEIENRSSFERLRTAYFRTRIFHYELILLKYAQSSIY